MNFNPKRHEIPEGGGMAYGVIYGVAVIAFVLLVVWLGIVVTGALQMVLRG